ncbi:hypothetical protein [Winogradskyella haliclonae]|uniref:Uncharacterized protein n=1 Tax=Winogradskyella haliclonae TaxID=2048558 RepID=A0ABQ2BU26_9FLAO|nr:hypothetical protein [Winogradskyella haliclonae]GGI55945.1 hypothetical protein GCM10011444_02540 [Winogradskyella haliclonae]
MKTIKILLSTISLIFSLSISNAHEIDTNFYPKKAEDVTNEVYRSYIKKLENSYAIIKNIATKDLNYLNYWNIAICYAYMKVDKEIIHQLLLSSKQKNASSFCMILNYEYESHKSNLEDIRLYKIFGKTYLNWISDCEGIHIKSKSLEELLKEKEQLNLEHLNEPLIEKLLVLLEKDQRYRGNGHSAYENNREKQHRLDREVEQELIKIFEEFGYPSKELVGDTYARLGCLLLEHSGQPKTQKKYIPLVANALKTDNSIRPYFKMLIDRYYWRTTGKQVFGSHAGIPFQSDEIISEIKKKYSFSVEKSVMKLNQNSRKIIIKKQ